MSEGSHIEQWVRRATLSTNLLLETHNQGDPVFPTARSPLLLSMHDGGVAHNGTCLRLRYVFMQVARVSRLCSDV